MTPWQAVTRFGDSALLLPLILWTTCSLALLAADWRMTRRWVLAVGIGGGIVCLSKLLFMAWGIGPPGLDYTGFSGHTTLAMLVWPSLAALLTRDADTRTRRVAIAAGCMVAIGVAVSRLALKVHSPSEVWLGALLGMLVMGWFVRGVTPSPVTRTRQSPRVRWFLAAGMLVIGFLCYGRVFPSQHLLQDIALWISGHRDVFTRRMRLG